jgi:hypothetical protein
MCDGEPVPVVSDEHRQTERADQEQVQRSRS